MGFIEFTWDHTYSDDEAMVSFGVKALFTSVPIEAACEVARQRLGNSSWGRRHNKIISALFGYDIF